MSSSLWAMIKSELKESRSFMLSLKAKRESQHRDLEFGDFVGWCACEFCICLSICIRHIFHHVFAGHGTSKAIKMMSVFCALLMVGCMAAGNQFQTSAGLFTSTRETLAYGNPAGRVDPGQVAFRHGARLDETAGVLSAATIQDPAARETATDALVKISKEKNSWGYGWGADNYGGGYGGGGNFSSTRENILQRGAVVNRSDYPVRVEFAPTATYNAPGQESSGRPQSMVVRARNYEVVTLPPGEYRFVFYDLKGQVIKDCRNQKIDWVRGNSEFRAPGTSNTITVDWFTAVD